MSRQALVPEQATPAPGDLERLRRILDEAMERERELFAAIVPEPALLLEGEGPRYHACYLRHRIETVRRIRETAATDALALAALCRESYEAARPWAAYTVEEMGHDRLFLVDLARHGLEEEAVFATPPFAATRRLVRWLEEGVRLHGATPAVAYSLYVEWNAERAAPRAVENAARAFSPGHVVGARGHLGIDTREDHYGMLVGIAWHLVHRRGSVEFLLDCLQRVGLLLRDYFRELHDAAEEQGEAGTRP